MSESGWGLTNEKLNELWDYLEELWEEEKEENEDDE
jgi:hypothetical protein